MLRNRALQSLLLLKKSTPSRTLAIAKSIFVCENCKKTSYQYLGKCPSCDEFNSFKEKISDTPSSVRAKSLDREKQRWISPVSSSSLHSTTSSSTLPTTLMTADTPINVSQASKSSLEHVRLKFDDLELMRVFGGGLVMGSVILLSGSPGIGKSTLALQLADAVSQQLPDNKRVLYLSGEESVSQIGIRAKRLTSNTFNRVDIQNEANLSKILSAFNPDCPHGALVVDSIQAVYLQEQEAEAGGVNQIKACAMAVTRLAKASGVPVIIIGHITKGGDIAGPQLLSHAVDVVLFFDGDSSTPHRFLTASKNRFGPNEVGVFEMTDAGFVPLAEGSKTFVSEHSTPPEGVSWIISTGTATTTSLSTRFMLSEVQILTNPIPSSEYMRSRRVKSSGIPLDRIEWLSAVLVKHTKGMDVLDRSDLYINVVGGLFLNDRGCDLGLAMALASARLGQSIQWPQRGKRSGTAFVGEIGLTGDVRLPRAFVTRLHAADKAGLAKVVVPKRWEQEFKSGLNPFKEMEIVGVENVSQAVELCLEKARKE